MNSLQQYTKEFHEAFGHPVTDKPTALESKRAVSRSVWTGEELVEFLAASSSDMHHFTEMYNDFISGLSKAFAKSLESSFTSDGEKRVIAQADAITDALYFLFGTCTELGVDIEKIFEIVHKANMSKLFTAEDGTKYAKYDENNGGKIMKSPDFYQPEPFIKKEIMRQIKG